MLKDTTLKVLAYSITRVALEHVLPGENVLTIILLFVLCAIAVAFLLGGEDFVQVAIVSVTLVVSFVGFLILFLKAFSSYEPPMTGSDKCDAPFGLAIACCLVVTGIVAALIKETVALAVFLVSAGAGLFFMAMIRMQLVRDDPKLLLDEGWVQGYAIGTVVVAIVLGLASLGIKHTLIILVTVTSGSFGLAYAISGLVVSFHNPPMPVHVFQIIVVVSAIVGLLVQGISRYEKMKEKAKDKEANKDTASVVEMMESVLTEASQRLRRETSQQTATSQRRRTEEAAAEEEGARARTEEAVRAGVERAVSELLSSEENVASLIRDGLAARRARSADDVTVAVDSEEVATAAARVPPREKGSESDTSQAPEITLEITPTQETELYPPPYPATPASPTQETELYPPPYPATPAYSVDLEAK